MMRSQWVVVLVLLVACDKKSDDKKQPPKPALVTPADTKRIDLGDPPKPADPFAGWTERTGDGFSVLAPQEPKVTKKDTTATGKPLPTTMYTHYVPDGPGAVQVMFTELDPKAKIDPSAMFDAMKSSMIKQFSGTVRKQADIAMGTAKGQEYWLDGEHPRMGKLSVHVKFLLHERRLYLVQSLHAADAAAFGAQGDKFVDSFKLL
jgi:hypothetical protein